MGYNKRLPSRFRNDDKFPVVPSGLIQHQHEYDILFQFACRNQIHAILEAFLGAAFSAAFSSAVLRVRFAGTSK